MSGDVVHYFKLFRWGISGSFVFRAFEMHATTHVKKDSCINCIPLKLIHFGRYLIFVYIRNDRKYMLQ